MTVSDSAQLSERQTLIVERAEQQGFVTIEALAQDLDVSTQTVRREIIRLDELGVLQRFHGGAGKRGSGERLTHAAKQTREADLKQRIGLAMAERISVGQSVFLDVGTTGEAVAEALLGRGSLSLMTPSATIARILLADPAVDVVLTGGRVLGPDISMAGPVALRTIASHRFDWAVIGCSAVEDGGAVLDFDADKIALKQRAMELSARKALMVDSAKFSRVARLHLADLRDFDLLVTDALPARTVLRSAGEMEVIVA